MEDNNFLSEWTDGKYNTPGWGLFILSWKTF